MHIIAVSLVKIKLQNVCKVLIWIENVEHYKLKKYSKKLKVYIKMEKIIIKFGDI